MCDKDVAEYVKRFGNVVSADSAKTMLPGYIRSSPESQDRFHPAACVLVKKVFKYFLPTRRFMGNKSVVFMAGGNGAGKSTAVSKLKEKADSVFDSTMGDLPGSRESIQRVIGNGERPVLLFVYRNPVSAWKAILGRVEDGGHIVPADSFARTHVTSRENFLLLSKEFGDKVDSIAFETLDGRVSQELSASGLAKKPVYSLEDLKRITHETR